MIKSKIVHKIVSTSLPLISFPSFFFMPRAILLGVLGNLVLLLGSMDFSVLIPVPRTQGQRSLGSVEPHDSLMWMISQIDELVYAGSFCGGSGETI